MDRYTHPVASLFEPDATVSRWLAIEQAVADAQGITGLIPMDAALAINRIPPIAAQAVAIREIATGHDVAAFVQLMGECCDPEHARWVHYGLTSSDIVDTANAIMLARARDMLCGEARALFHMLRDKARYASEHNLVRMGRTHGQHAEPIHMTDQFGRLAERVVRAHDVFADYEVPMKLSGPVGSFGVNNEQIEGMVAAKFGLRIAPDATQIVPRDHYARWAFNVQQLAGACERVATEIRLSAQTGVQELAEGFGAAQIGSSSMPHKRNPVRSERICGLARVVRGLLMPILETADQLWGERDISNSSVERTALGHLTVLTGYLLRETTEVVRDLKILVPPNQVFDKPASVKLAEAVAAGEDRNAAHARIATLSSRKVD